MDTTVPVVPERPAPRGSPRDRVVEWVRWFGPARLIVGVLAVLGVAIAVFWLVRSPAPPAEDAMPMATTTTAAATDTTEVVEQTTSESSAPPRTEIVVHVAGAVVNPGVRHLAVEARVVDAIAAAGGVTADAAADSVNLAAPLHDGDRIYVPRVDDGSEVPVGVTPAPPGELESPGPVALNAATAAQLETLPGIGPSLANAIVGYRDEHGPFLDVEQLADVPGIGPAKLAALRDLVTV